MGVKVKTPSPFVGAGSVGTFTPNLSGMGNAIAGVAGDLLTTRFEDRKQVALEEGEIQSHNLITYDENGQLKPITSLPEDNTWYSQALRAGARTNYYNALGADIKNFTAKTLAEHPNDPLAVKEKMDIYRDSALLDLDESLVGTTKHMLKTISDESVLISQGNLFNKQKADGVINGTLALERIETLTYSQASNYNGGIFKGKLAFGIEEQYKEALILLAASGAKGHSLESIPQKIQLFKEKVQVYKSLYRSKKWLKIIENDTNYTEVQINNAQKELITERLKISESYNKNLVQKELFVSEWNKKVNQIQTDYTDKKNIDDERIKNIQSTNYAASIFNIQSGNYNEEAWLENSSLVDKAIINKDYSIPNLISLHSAYFTKIGADETKQNNLKTAMLMNGYEHDRVTETELLAYPFITNNAVSMNTFFKLQNKKIADNDTHLRKIGEENQDLFLMNVVERMPIITQDPKSLLYAGNTKPFTMAQLEKELGEKGLNLEIFNNGTYDKSSALQKIITARKEYIGYENKKQRIIKAEEYSRTNGTSMSDADHTDWLKLNDVFETFNIEQDDPLVFYNKWNKPLRTLNGPLEQFINNPENLTQGQVDKMLPLIESMINPNKPGYSKDNNEMFLFKVNKPARDFWKNYVTGLSSVDSAESAFKLAKKEHLNSKKPEVRNHGEQMFNRHFKSMKSREYNALIGGPIVKNLDLGLRSWQNLIIPTVAVATLGIIGDNKAIQNKGMDISYLGSEEMMDVNNIDHQIEYVKINFENIASKSEGIIDFFQDKLKMDSWNDASWRAIVGTWGPFGNISKIPLPTVVASETLDRYKIRFADNPGPYMEHPENRDKALFKIAMEVLKERNYSVELSGKDGMLAHGPVTKDYTPKWKRNSITSAMMDSGWDAAKIRPNPKQMGNEIAHMFHNMKWNKNPQNPKKYLFTPQMFGENSFHDVSWMIKPNGFNANGTPIAEIYWFDKENSIARALKIKELYPQGHEKEGQETGIVMNVSYPYEYKNSFYNVIYKDQSGKIEEYLKNNKWIQEVIGGKTTDLLQQAYLNGLNLFGNSDMAGWSPNFMNIIMQSYEYEMTTNGGADARTDIGENDKPRISKFDWLKIEEPKPKSNMNMM